jgi:hypothetical protein
VCAEFSRRLPIITVFLTAECQVSTTPAGAQPCWPARRKGNMRDPHPHIRSSSYDAFPGGKSSSLKGNFAFRDQGELSNAEVPSQRCGATKLNLYPGFCAYVRNNGRTKG